MKLISLNTFGGTIFEPLMSFIAQHKDTADIFCFQEIISAEEPGIPLVSNGARLNLLQEISAALPNFQMRFAPVQDGFDTVTVIDHPIRFGPASFIKNNLAISASGNFFLCHGYNSFVPNQYDTLGYGLLYTQINVAETVLTICNTHGTSEPGNKLDTPERINQSKKILDFVNHQPGEKIIAGDFNLFPNTQSIAMLEQADFRNLISEYKITTTRGSLMKKLHSHFANGPFGFQEFADYTFVSPGIRVINFEVPDVPISDHLPMILEFEVKTTDNSK